MTDQSPWLKYKERNPVHVIAEFKNVYDEQFVIYRLSGDTLYITGDEFGWEPRVRLLWGSFVYSEDERNQIAKILFPTFADYFGASLDKLSMRTGAREWVAEIIAAHPGIDTAIPLTDALKAWEDGRSPDEITAAQDAMSALSARMGQESDGREDGAAHR